MASGQANAEIMSERSPALTGLHEQPILAMRNNVASSITGHYHKGVGSDDLNIVYNCENRSDVLGFDLAQITSKLNYSNPKKGDPQPPLNTLGQGYIAYENHPADSRITETGSISQQLTSRMGTGGGNVPLVQELTMASGVRRLTPTECERLQGFPDGWTESQSDTQRYKQMGNAVTVNVAEWIGERIAEVNK